VNVYFLRVAFFFMGTFNYNFRLLNREGRMKRLVGYLLVLGFVIACSGIAQAGTVTITPGDLTATKADATANPTTTKYAFDWEGPAPIGSYTVGGAPGFASGAWYSDVSGSASNVPDNGRDYTALRLFPTGIFEGPVTVSNLLDITYWSNWVGGAVDWQVKIYTVPTSGIGPTDWYNTRVNYNTGNMLGQGWQFWSANSLGVSSVTDKNPGSAYSNEQIMFIDIIASYASSSPASYTYLDGVTISLKDGRSHTMNLEVPEPGLIVLLGLGLAGIAAAWKKLS
jgi:hypothetical protein